MAKYQKNVSVGGNWAKASELKSGMRAKIVSETNPMPSSFFDKNNNPKTQDVCKVKFEGLNDVLNVSLNRATINGLVDAFGEDSVKWQNQVLTVETEKVRVAGKAVTALYLVPDGYEKVDNNEGFAEIVRKGEVMAKQAEQGMPQANEIPIINDEEPTDLPF